MKGFGEKNQSKKEKISKNKQKVNAGQLIKKAFDLRHKDVSQKQQNTMNILLNKE